MTGPKRGNRRVASAVPDGGTGGARSPRALRLPAISNRHRRPGRGRARLYGRGSCDMKGGIAAAVVALESILAAGVRFDGALEVSGTVDEESGGCRGRLSRRRAPVDPQYQRGPRRPAGRPRRPAEPDRGRQLPDDHRSPFLIEEDLAQVKAELVAILDQLRHDRPGFAYRIRDLMEVLPTQTARDAPVVRAVAAAIERVTGRSREFVCSPGTCDQKHVFRIGRLEDCIAYGPGMVQLAHQPDEYVAIDDLVASAKVMATAALRLLGVGSD